jgi:hypothetical protein
MDSFKLPDGRILVINKPTAPSKRQVRRQHTRTGAGWESKRQRDSLQAPGSRFWYAAVWNKRSEEPSRTGCIVVPDETGFRSDGSPERF